jgi:hypothetical protein
MNIKVFAVNDKNKIEFTREELEKILNDLYEEAYKAGEKAACGKINNSLGGFCITETNHPYTTPCSDSNSTSNQINKNEGLRIKPLSPEDFEKLSATFAKQDDVWNRLARELGGL